MRFSLTLLESESQIRNAILQQIISVIDPVLDRAINDLQNNIKDIITIALKEEPEYASLTGGKLKADFGLPDASMVDAVIAALVNTLQITKKTITISNSGLNGGFTLSMMPSRDMGGVLATAAASVTDAKGYSLPWLEWLLFRNNEILVKNYDVQYGASPYSRSGLAIMVPSESSWRVPPEFAGSEDSNWTTRAVDRAESRIYSIIQQSIEKYL